MLKKLFLDYQKNPRNSIAFLKLATFLEPKIFTIFKSINCDNNYREDFIQSCHLKLLDVVNEVVFKEDATDNTISAYLERAFLTVKRDFTKTYHLYHLNISLDETDENDVPLLDKIPVIETKEVDNSDIFSQIEIVLSKKDYLFLMLFINKEAQELRSISEVATHLRISKAAVSKRFTSIKMKLQKVMLKENK